MLKTKRPNFSFEEKLWGKGLSVVAGLDEVGRGCLAGPVVAAACAFAPISSLQFPIYNREGEKVVVRDSKKMTDRQRRVASKWIYDNCLTWGIGMSSVSEINKFGLSKSICSAFRRAVGNANRRVHARIDYLLIDAFYIPYVRGYPKGKKQAIHVHAHSQTHDFSAKQLAIIKGDDKSFSIASASIIAKVYRDDLMIILSKKNDVYGWDKNKGYGTIKHRTAIKKYGVTKYHRKDFVSRLW